MVQLMSNVTHSCTDENDITGIYYNVGLHNICMGIMQQARAFKQPETFS